MVETRNVFDLDVANVRGLPREEFEPPMDAISYRVRFYYTSKRSVQEYWDEYGKSWSKRVDKFAEPSPAITSAAQEFTSGAKTEDEKLQKLYNAVMKLENTRFTSIFAGSAYFRKEDHQLMWPMWVAKIRANGTPGDKLDLFDVTDINAAEAVEQSVAEKEKVCKLGYPT